MSKEALEKYLKEKYENATNKQKENLANYGHNIEVAVNRKLSNYLWREGKGTIPTRMDAIYWNIKVEKETKTTYHTVVLTNHPTKGWVMWCGDKYLREEEGVEEDYCFCWKNKTAACYHQLWVAEQILNNEGMMNDIIDLLGEGKVASTPSVKTDAILEAIETAYELKLPMLIYGPTGTGKSHTVLKFVKDKGEDVEFFQLNMSSGLEDIDLLAKYLPDNESGKWKTVDGELWKAFKSADEGKEVVILIEELTRASKSARNLLLKALDPVSGKYKLQNFATGEEIEVETDKIMWFATANIGYSDTDELDPALMRRFLITQYVGYDTEKEKQILTDIGLEEEVAKRIIEKIVKPLRKAYQLGEIEFPLDTGTLKVFANVYKKTEDAMKSCELTFLYRLVGVDTTSSPNPEQVELIRDIIKEAGL